MTITASRMKISRETTFGKRPHHVLTKYTRPQSSRPEMPEGNQKRRDIAALHGMTPVGNR